MHIFTRSYGNRIKMLNFNHCEIHTLTSELYRRHRYNQIHCMFFISFRFLGHLYMVRGVYYQTDSLVFRISTLPALTIYTGFKMLSTLNKKTKCEWSYCIIIPDVTLGNDQSGKCIFLL